VALEIIWTKEAQKQLSDIITLYEDQNNQSFLKQFSRQLEYKLKLISEHPRMYQKSDRLNDTRRCLLNRYHSLYYTHDQVYICDFLRR